MEYFVVSKSKRNKEFFERIIPKMIKELKLTRSRKTVMIKITNKECGDHDGATAPLDMIDSYVVLIKPKSLKDMGITLAHEMVHVKQLAKGTLRQVNGVNYWKGKKYRKNHRYLDLPWEVEAFSKQELLFRKSIE